MNLRCTTVRVCRLALAVVVTTAGLGGVLRGQAVRQQELGALYHWAYSAAFGTGYYQFGEDKVYVLKAEPVVGLSWFESRGVTTRLRLPFTFGLQNIDLGRIGDILDLENNLKTFSFTPGLEFLIPVNDSWELRPYAHAGWGTHLGGEDRSRIYYLGLNSRLVLPPLGQFRLLLINGLQTYGHDPDNGRTDRFWRLVTGLEGSYPLGDWHIAGRQAFLKPHVAHYWYFNGVDFSQILRPPVQLRQEFEIGLAIGFEERISLKLFGFDRAGIAFRRGGNLDGIRFYISSIFQ